MRKKSQFMRLLTSDIQLYTAQMDQMPIVIFTDAELVGSGVIEDITEMSVMRGVCTFKYAEGKYDY
ncbi:hypothetical protein [Paenibacillus sp. M2]|uniref:hypothetical protein n=1 Tax=Paenibacillus sp. M2 TaxID=3341793 RepID=UPI003989EECA